MLLFCVFKQTDPPETNHLSPMCNITPTSKIEEKLNKNGMIYPTHLYNRRRALDGSNVETQKKSKTVPQLEQDVSDCSAIDSLSCMSASSNDAAKMIGEKRFWKMRTYMIK